MTEQIVEQCRPEQTTSKYEFTVEKQTITRDTEILVNSVSNPFLLKIGEMNNTHLANFLKCLRERIQTSLHDPQLIHIVMKEAWLRGLSDKFLNKAYFTFDETATYKKYKPSILRRLYWKLKGE